MWIGASTLAVVGAASAFYYTLGLHGGSVDGPLIPPNRTILDFKPGNTHSRCGKPGRATDLFTTPRKPPWSVKTFSKTPKRTSRSCTSRGLRKVLQVSPFQQYHVLSSIANACSLSLKLKLFTCFNLQYTKTLRSITLCIWNNEYMHATFRSNH